MRRADRTSIGDQPMTREGIIAAWSDITGTPPVKDATSAFRTALQVLNNPNEEWNKRCLQIKMIRAILLQSPEDAPLSYLPMIAEFNGPLEKAVRDLRSQIVKEAALTVSFLVYRYKMELRALAELCLPAAFAQTAVSTKIIASSAAAMSTFLVGEVHSKQMFVTIASFITSKDKNHRKQAVNLLGTVVESWDDKAMTTVLRQLCEHLKTAINDADSETRVAARKSFKLLDQRYPADAEKLFRSVDSSKQKLLRAPDGGSSMSSLNGDRNTPFRSKLSLSNSSGPKPAAFLAQRSHTAMDRNTLLSKVDTSPGGSKFARPTFSMGVRASSGLRNSSLIPAPKRPSNLKRRDDVPQVLSGIQRIKSNLGPESFSASLSAKQAADFEESMRKTQETLRQPSRNEDDEFLLPVRPSKTPVKEQLSRVDAILKAATSIAPNEKREGIQNLKSLAADTTLSEVEVRKIGDVLGRLASEITTPVILDTLCTLVQTHHSKLISWLDTGLNQLFAMTQDLVPGRKSQVAHTIDCILETFDPTSLLRAQCDIMNNRIILMKTAARIPFLDFMATLFQRLSPAGLQKCLIHVGMDNLKTTMFKTLDWVSDAKNGNTLQPHVEKVLHALFTLNNSVFYSIFEGADEKHRVLLNNILPNPPVRRITEELQNLPRSRRSDPLIVSPKTESPRYKLTAHGVLRPINGDELEQSLSKLEISQQSAPRDAYNVQPVPEETEVQKIIRNLSAMSNGNEHEKLEGIMQLQKMVSDGSLTLCDEWLPKIRDALFVVLQTGVETCKRRALRFIVRLCQRCSSQMRPSTEQTMEYVLNCAVDSQDPSTKLCVTECLKTLSTTLVMSKVVEMMRNELTGNSDDKKEIVLEMVSEMCEKLEDFEIKDAVDSLAPLLVETYNTELSAKLRKKAASGLLSMRNKMGPTTMQQHISKLPMQKQNVLEKLDTSTTCSVRSSDC